MEEASWTRFSRFHLSIAYREDELKTIVEGRPRLAAPKNRRANLSLNAIEFADLEAIIITPRIDIIAIELGSPIDS